MTKQGFAQYLTAPTTGYRVWFQVDPFQQSIWFQRWYSSLKAAKSARTKMKVINPVIVGYDGTVI